MLLLLRTYQPDAPADEFTADGPASIGMPVKTPKQLRIGAPGITPTGERLGALQLRVALSRIGRAR